LSRSIEFLKYDLILFIHEKVLSHAAEDTGIVVAIVYNFIIQKMPIDNPIKIYEIEK
jgi:hypothetical protein